MLSALSQLSWLPVRVVLQCQRCRSCYAKSIQCWFTHTATRWGVLPLLSVCVTCQLCTRREQPCSPARW